MFYLLPTVIHFYENVPKVHKTFYTLLLTAPNPPTCKRSSHNISMVITTNIIILIIIIIRGGVRLRSRLSPEGGPNQKWYFRVKSGTVFINSCVLEAYNMKSYKKLDQKSPNLQITTFTMGNWTRIVIICKKLVFFLKTQFPCDFYNIH